MGVSNGGLNACQSTANAAFAMCGLGLVLAWNLKADSENRQSPSRGTKSQTMPIDSVRAPADRQEKESTEPAPTRPIAQPNAQAARRDEAACRPHPRACAINGARRRIQRRTFARFPVFLLTTSNLTCAKINVRIIEIEFEFNFTK